MNTDRRSFGATLIAGVLVVVPVYLGILLLLKVTQHLVELLKPVTALLPGWLPGDQILSLVLVLAICFLVGVAIGTPTGRDIERRIEHSLFEKIPGYALFRSLTQRLVGESQDEAWKPALAEIEHARYLHLSLKSMRMAATRSLCLRCPHRLLVPSSFFRPIAFIQWTSLLRRL